MDDKTKLKKIIDLSNDPEMALLNATEEVGVKVDNSTQSIKEAITEAVASIEIPIPKDESETLNLILEEVKKKPDLEEVISTVYDEVIANLPEVTDGKDGRDGVDGKEGLQGKQGERGFDGEDGLDGKNGSPDEPEEIRDKLETLKGQDRLDKKAIKGLDKMIEQDTLDRAVSILDQRTSFLINKVSNLQTSVSNIPSGVTSVSSSDSSLTVSPTTGAVNAIINTAHANSWTALQTITKTGSILQLGRTATLKWSAVVNTAGRIVWNAVGGDETDPYFQVPIIYASAGYFQSSTGQPTTGVGASFFETGITNGESFGSGEKIATFRISTSTYNYANGSYTHVAGTRATFTDPVTVPDDPYSASWDGNTDVPTKNAVYDKIQALGGGYQVPTGTVDGSNQVFTFTVAPNVIVVDQGRTMQKTSSDGTVNWTGTTTVTLSVAPNFDAFSIA